jgi:CRP-like cAMP-binding protein
MSGKRILNRDTYYPGHILMRQGEYGHAAYFVERGRVRVYIEDAKGKKVVLAELGPISVVGEMAVISQEPRSATVEVIEESVLVQITAVDFSEKLRKIEPAFQTVLKMLIDRLKQANRHILDTDIGATRMEDRLQSIQALAGAIEKDLPEKNRDAFNSEMAQLLQKISVAVNKYK